MVEPRELSFFYVDPPPPPAETRAVQARLLMRHTQLDLDALKPTQHRAWWLLYAGQHAEVSFSGSRLGILTIVGPDAGEVVCEVDGERTFRRPLLDKWAYFWRVAVVTLAEGLAAGEHTARVYLAPEVPSARVLKRPPAGANWERCVAEGKQHKLWLMYWLIGE